jgi:hypothetical protein
MIRSCFGLILAVAVPCAASAGDFLPSGQSAKPRVNSRCAAMGEGFFPVQGSDACIKISGRISAGVALGNGVGSGKPSGSSFPTSSPSDVDAETVVNGDLRFDTPSGPGRIYVGVRRDTNPHWIMDAQ